MWKQKHVFADLTAAVTQSHYAVHELMQKAAAQMEAVRQLYGMLSKDASLIAFNFLFRLSAIVFYVCVPFVWLLPGVKGSGAQSPVVE